MQKRDISTYFAVHLFRHSFTNIYIHWETFKSEKCINTDYKILINLLNSLEKKILFDSR